MGLKDVRPMIITKPQALAIAVVLALVGVAAAARGEVGEVRQAQAAPLKAGFAYHGTVGHPLGRL
jgi:hypothetical protein